MSQYGDHLREIKCTKCGKVFIPAVFHIYRAKTEWYCGWNCYNHRDDDKPKKKEESKC